VYYTLCAKNIVKYMYILKRHVSSFFFF
jgi:hypothetical protein